MCVQFKMSVIDFGFGLLLLIKSLLDSVKLGIQSLTTSISQDQGYFGRSLGAHGGGAFLGTFCTARPFH